MDNLKNIISKNVLCKNCGDVVGYALNIAFNKRSKKFSGIVVVDNESEEEFFVNRSKIISSKDYVVINDFSTCLNYDDQKNFMPFGKKIISIDGVDLGRVKECFLQKKQCCFLVTEKAEINIKNIYNLDKKFLLFSPKKIIKKNEQKKIKNITIPKIQKVKILQEKKESEKINFTIKKEIKNELKKNDLILNSKNNIINENNNLNYVLIGKIAKINVFGINNELIIKQGEKVNEKIIKKAKNHNKLNILANSVY